jgi:hypothetical protein
VTLRDSGRPRRPQASTSATSTAPPAGITCQRSWARAWRCWTTTSTALEALIGDYSAELRGRTPPERQLADLCGDVYRAVRAICEWRLGREAEGMPAVADGAKTVEEIVACLKRIQKSVRRWTKEGGRQGYLRFVGQYL